MKKILYFLLVMPLIIFTSCDDSDCDDDDTHSLNKVLMLKVNYATFNFEGGIEYSFDQKTDSFTIDLQYNNVSYPETFLLIYKELNETLLSGIMNLNGVREITFPQTIDSPEFFETVSTDDIVFPSRGFTNVYIPLNNWDIEFFNAWLSIQNLKTVRKFLRSNPNQQVKFFVYAPNGYASSNSDYYIFIQN